MKAPAASAGFTLIEVMISLAIFSLVAIAGMTLVNSVLDVEDRTRGRLDRLGEMQRTMHLLTRDLEQASVDTLELSEGALAFRRHAATIYDPGLRISYSVEEGALVRSVNGAAPAGQGQTMLRGVTAARWSFFFPGRGWQRELPERAPERSPVAAGAPAAVEEIEHPRAVALDVVLNEEAGLPAGSLRRVVEFAAAPPPRQIAQ